MIRHIQFAPANFTRLQKRVFTACRSLSVECRACANEAAGVRSFVQLSQDFVLFRLLPYLPNQIRNREREVELRNGVRLRYRLNRGDIQSFREIWLERAYRLPFPVTKGVLVDLGANIGCTSIWLTKEYGFGKVIAVEPDTTNAQLARKNFDLNGIPGEVVGAAIGPADGIAKFQAADDSNQGRLSQEGQAVEMISMRSILDRFQLSEIDLVKIDIEGSEQALLTGPREWLSRTKAVIVEFHPRLVDCRALARLLELEGFNYVPANTAFPNNGDSFYRPERVNLC